MTDAFIVDAVRTPVGKNRGGLSTVHPADLTAHALNALVDRSGLDPAVVDDFILGCANQIGAQAANMARTAWLSAGLPIEVPATTVDRRCGSSQQAVDFAAQAIMAGAQDVVVAGGVESMSTVPLGSPAKVGEEQGFGGTFAAEGWIRRFGAQPVTQFNGAQMIADKWAIDRDTMEEYALESHRRAIVAQDERRFDREIIETFGLSVDEGPRRNTSKEKLAGLLPLSDGGSITPGLASQVSDGAAVLLLASGEACARFNWTPRARLVASAVVGSDPIMMLAGPVPATHKVLDRAGLSIDDIDLFEVNEAFAPVPIMWARETGAALEKTNVNGGAIALGHPLGATGARLMTTLLHEMERSGSRYGLQTMCEGSGTANATVIERL